MSRSGLPSSLKSAVATRFPETLKLIGVLKVPSPLPSSSVPEVAMSSLPSRLKSASTSGLLPWKLSGCRKETCACACGTARVPSKDRIAAIRMTRATSSDEVFMAPTPFKKRCNRQGPGRTETKRARNC